MFKYLLNNSLNVREKIVYTAKQFFRVKSQSWSEDDISVFDNGVLSSSEEIPKIIWLFWNNSELPGLIQLTIEQIRNLNPTYTVNVLNIENCKQYLPDLDLTLTKHGMPAFSDLLRLKLLSVYGGIWMDASILTFLPLDVLFSKLKIDNRKVILFNHPRHCIDKKYPVFESWFIAAPLNSKFIAEWYKDFEGCLTSDNPKTYYENVLPNYQEVVQNIPGLDYLMVYVSGQVVFRKLYEECDIQFIKAEKIGFSYYFYNGVDKEDGRLLNKLLAIYKAPKDVSPLIKLSSYERRVLEKWDKDKLINGNSIIGQLMKKHKIDRL